MKKLILVTLIFLSLTTSAQTANFNKVTFGLYPAFDPSSTITINFKKSEVSFKVDGKKQTDKFEISMEEQEILKSVINNLLSNAEPPVDTLTINGKKILLDGRLTEDGMTTYVYLNSRKRPSIQLGNSYSKLQAESLSKLAYLIKTKTKNNEYIDKIHQYLK